MNPKAFILFRLVLSVFFALGVVFTTQAQQSIEICKPVTSYFSTNSDPRLVPDGAGGFFVAYKSIRGSSHFATLFAQHINAKGQPLWAADGLEVCPITHGNQANHRIAADGEGGVFIVWESVLPGQTKERVWAQRLNANGENLWGREGRLVCPKNTRQLKPVIQPDGAGGLYVFWEDYREGDADLFGQRLNAEGKPAWPADGRPILILPGPQQNIQIDLAPDRSALIMWEDFRNGSHWQIFCQKIKLESTLLWDKEGVSVSKNENINHRHPSFFGDGFGGVICVYEALGGTTNNKDVYFSRISRNGEIAMSKPICDLRDDQARPKAALKGADAVVYWEDHRDGHANIYAQMLDLMDGSLQWGAEGAGVSRAAGDQTRPDFVSTTYYGDQIIAWEDGRSGEKAIFAQKINKKGEPLWTFDGMKISSLTGNQQNFQMTSDDKGGAWIVWVDESSTRHSAIYYQRVLSEGKLFLDANGVILQAPNETLHPRLDFPAIEKGFYNDAFIAWEDYRNGKKNSDIYLQRIDREGRPLWRKEGVPVCTAPNLQSLPRLLAVKNGVYVVWIDRRENDDDLYMQFIDTLGRLRWPLNGLPLCRAPRSQNDVTLVRSEHERAIVAWVDARSFYSQEFDIFLQIVDTTGAFYWGENGQPVAIDASAQSAPCLAPDGDEGGNLVWMDMRSGHYNIYIQNINRGGVTQWKDGGYRVTRTESHQRYPEIFTDPQGYSYIVWADDRMGFEFTKIFIQKIDRNGRALFGTQGAMVCNQFGRQTMPQVAPDGQGGVIVTWLDQRNEKQSSFNLFAQRIDKNGQPMWDKWGIKMGEQMRENAPYKLLAGISDDFLVAWQQEDEDGKQSIYCEQRNAATGALEVKFDTGYAAGQRLHPGLIQFSNGRKALVWLEKQNEGGVQRVSLKILD